MLNSTKNYYESKIEFFNTNCFTNTYKIILVSYFGIENFTPVKCGNLVSEAL